MLLAQCHEGVYAFQCAVTLFRRSLAATATQFFEFRVTVSTLGGPGLSETVDIGVVIVQISEAIVLDITQDHRRVVANTNVPNAVRV